MPLSLAASMAIALAAGAPSTSLSSDPSTPSLEAMSIAASAPAGGAAVDPAPALAQSSPAGSLTEAQSAPWYALSPGKKFGLGLDIGAPQGAGLTVLFRPWWWLEFNAGLAYNVIGTGIRGGLTVSPVRFPVRPTLSFDLGHYFSGDLTKFTSTSDPYQQALLKDAAYDFWSAQLGLEVGSRNSFSFYLRGGVTHVGATLPGPDFTNYVNEQIGSATDTYQVGDANFSALLPCVSLGFILFVL